MPDHAAFIRAINLGKNRRVSGADLCAIFEDAGLDEAASFRTSGNVVFTGGRESKARLTGRIEEALAGALGYEVSVLLRTAKEVRAISASEPFDPSLVEASKGKLQVCLLSKKPAAGPRAEVEALASDDDLLHFGGRELYWLPSGGYSDSKLDGRVFEELLGPLTVRTMGTVEALAAKYFAS